MKKYFYLMSLMLCMVFGSMAFVSCDDDDDDDAAPDTSITANQILGCWYGIDENTSERVGAFVVKLQDGGRGVYAEYKARAKHDWEPEGAQVEIEWQLTNGTLTMTCERNGEVMERKADLLKLSGNKMNIRRYLEEGQTDQMTIERCESLEAAEDIFWNILEEKFN